MPMTRHILLPIDPTVPRPLRFNFDGTELTARANDTVLAAVLAALPACGTNEFDGAPRAGFCLMGSCQECTMWDQDGHRIRGCTTPVRPGMSLRSHPYAGND